MSSNSLIVGESFRLLGVAENVVLNTNPIKQRGLFIDSQEVDDYDLLLVSTVSRFMVQNEEQKFQFVRRF